MMNGTKGYATFQLSEISYFNHMGEIFYNYIISLLVNFAALIRDI